MNFQLTKCSSGAWQMWQKDAFSASLGRESGNLGPCHFLALSQSWFEKIPPNILWLESGLSMETPGSDPELVSSALAASFHSPEHLYPVYPNIKM